MAEQQPKTVFRACGHCGRQFETEELYDLYAAVSYAVNTDAVLVDDPSEIEFCPSCGQDW